MALDGATFETLGPVFTYYRENEITASFNLSEGTEGDVLEIAVDDASPQTGCHNLKGARNSGQSTFFFLQQSSQTLCIMFTTISWFLICNSNCFLPTYYQSGVERAGRSAFCACTIRLWCKFVPVRSPRCRAVRRLSSAKLECGRISTCSTNHLFPQWTG